METFSGLLALCAGNSPVTDEFPSQRPVTQSFDVFFDLRLNKRLSKQSFGWWVETPSHPLWRHCNVCFLFYPILTLLYKKHTFEINRLEKLTVIFTNYACLTIKRIKFEPVKLLRSSSDWPITVCVFVCMFGCYRKCTDRLPFHERFYVCFFY